MTFTWITKGKTSLPVFYYLIYLCLTWRSQKAVGQRGQIKISPCTHTHAHTRGETDKTCILMRPLHRLCIHSLIQPFFYTNSHLNNKVRHNTFRRNKNITFTSKEAQIHIIALFRKNLYKQKTLNTTFCPAVRKGEAYISLCRRCIDLHAADCV